MGLLTMYDAVTVDNIPASARYVALYVDGEFNNLDAGKAHCPHADVLTITVIPADTGECCDCEPGDLTVEQAVAWVEQRLAADVYRPCVYADASRWSGGLQGALAGYGGRIRRWVAAYPGTGANVPVGFDAHQWSTGNLDTSVCLSNFFDAPAPPSGVAKAELGFDVATDQWTLKPLPGTVVWQRQPQWASLEVQVGAGGKIGGQWRTKPLPWNSPPSRKLGTVIHIAAGFHFGDFLHPLRFWGYQFWSGIGSDISEITLLGLMLGFLKHKNCHEKGCWRIGHNHPDHGFPVCRKHYKRELKI